MTPLARTTSTPLVLTTDGMQRVQERLTQEETVKTFSSEEFNLTKQNIKLFFLEEINCINK
jgi:hypothetical protein